MFIIDHVLVTESVVKKTFVCNLTACKGACCVQGDSGAPLTKAENHLIGEELSSILPFIPLKGRDAIQLNGISTIDADGDLTTTCVEGNKECAFTVFSEIGLAQCGIELAHKAGATTLLKPMSCHLYPIRIEERGHLEVLHYHQWHICSDACTLGAALKVPIYKFLEGALVRKYGQEWYNALEELVSEYNTEA